MLAFGCQVVVFKLSLAGTCLIYRKEEHLQQLLQGNTELPIPFVLAGCDYVDNIYGVGFREICQLLKSGRFEEEKTMSALRRKFDMAKKVKWPTFDEYLEQVDLAIIAFRHQVVFKLKRLSPGYLHPILHD